MNQEGFGGEKVSIPKTVVIEVTPKAQFFRCVTPWSDTSMWKKSQLLKTVELTKPKAQIRPRGDQQFHSAPPSLTQFRLCVIYEFFFVNCDINQQHCSENLNVHSEGASCHHQPSKQHQQPWKGQLRIGFMVMPPKPTWSQFHVPGTRVPAAPRERPHSPHWEF